MRATQIGAGTAQVQRLAAAAAMALSSLSVIVNSALLKRARIEPKRTD